MVDHSVRLHSKYSASAASRWFACPGSVRLSEGVPETTSSYALEGTKAHELLEQRLRADLALDHSDKRLAADAWVAAGRDTQAAVEIALDYVGDILARYTDAVVLLENRFTIPSEAAPGEVFGTNDICIYIPSLRLLYVIDYKHGAGVAVEVRGNKQLRFYGVGAVFASHLGWAVENVVLVIVQPRALHAEGPIREERISVSDLIDFSADIDDRLRATQEPDAPLVPGEEQCRFCPAKIQCPARERMALAAVGDSFSDVRQITTATVPDPATLSVDRIGHILGAKKLIIDWLEAVETHAITLASSGVHIPGRKLVAPYGRRSWNADTAAIAEELALLTATEPKDWFEMSLLGITAAETKLKAAAKALPGSTKTTVKDAVDKMAFLTTKKSSDKLTLVSEDDPRPPATTAVQAFDGVVPLAYIETGE